MCVDGTIDVMTRGPPQQDDLVIKKRKLHVAHFPS